ncbi:uncharacterized protein [Eurosta solidaginis]|uniref:uncharacterized protein n=1 Tax=Eurosta solidaginis TaxID=178769 RepID=UPI0035306BC6
MKMHLFVSCLAVLSVMLHFVLAASAVNVGLYAPDRYNDIPETCLKPMDFGYCRAKVKRYYFDMRRMKCAMFYFGGCAGNVNNFKSLEECNRVCLDGYGDYDSNSIDVAVGNKINSVGRDYRSRGSVSNTNNAIGAHSSRGSVNKSIKNHTSVTSFDGGSTVVVDSSYKNTYSKYNTNNNNYHTNTGGNSINVTNSGSGSSSSSNSSSSSSGSGTGVGATNNTKILRNRSDDNLDEYDYEEEN